MSVKTITLQIPGQPVCIVGMHRSGTSMVAQIANICGVSLGPKDDIIPPGEGNPTGFWESKTMDRITEDVLRQLSGGWDFLLPGFPENWTLDPQLAGLYEQAEAALRSLSMDGAWGWKDPRCSLVLPFWRRLLPNLRVILCLRHPVEVARSLNRRTGIGPDHCYDLWAAYNEHVLAAVPNEQLLITHYDSYFNDAQAEIQRIMDWLNINIPAHQIEAAAAVVSADVRQQTATAPAVDMLSAHEHSRLYAELCKMAAAKHLAPIMQTSTDVPVPDGEAADLMADAQRLIGAGDLPGAIVLLNRVINADPTLITAWNDLGVLLHAQGDLAAAVRAFVRAFDLDRSNLDQGKNLASLFLEAGRFEEAIQTFLDVVRYHPDDLESLAWLGAAAQKQDLNDLVRHYYRRVVALDPHHDIATAALRDL